jgi:hypothetical protein
MNTISAKKKENIVKRMNGIAFMVPFYLIFFLFCFLLDPRKINVNSSYHGFAEFLPL